MRRSGSLAVTAFAEQAEALGGGLIDRRGSSDEARHDDVPQTRTGVGACVDRVSRGFEHQQSAGNDKSVHDFAPSTSSLGSAPRFHSSRSAYYAIPICWSCAAQLRVVREQQLLSAAIIEADS